MKYESDKPCKAGHTLRYVKGNECVECNHIRCDKYHQNRTEDVIKHRREQMRGKVYKCSAGGVCKFKSGKSCTAHGNTKCKYKKVVKL